MTRVHLLDADGEFTPLFECVLCSIFEKFDVDGDGVWNEAELDAYARFTNGAPFDDEVKEEMRDNLEVNEKGWLELGGFMQMYHLQTEGDENETWNDLAKHGYDDQLDQVSVRKK